MPRIIAYFLRTTRNAKITGLLVFFSFSPTIMGVQKSGKYWFAIAMNIIIMFSMATLVGMHQI